MTIAKILFLLAAIGSYLVLRAYDLHSLIMTPIMLSMLIMAWRRQGVGYLTRRDFPGFFWTGMAIFGLIAVVGLTEYWDVIQRLGS